MYIHWCWNNADFRHFIIENHTYKGITLIGALRIGTDSSLICFDEVEGYKAPDRPHSSLSENDWSECSADCDGLGTQTRSRSLNNPVPLDKGADCEKDTKPDQFCHTGHCDGTYNMIYLFFSIFFMAVNQKQLIQLVIWPTHPTINIITSDGNRIWRTSNHW